VIRDTHQKEKIDGMKALRLIPHKMDELLKRAADCPLSREDCNQDGMFGL
jgi:hypothetical protein